MGARGRSRDQPTSPVNSSSLEGNYVFHDSSKWKDKSHDRLTPNKRTYDEKIPGLTTRESEHDTTKSWRHIFNN